MSDSPANRTADLSNLLQTQLRQQGELDVVDIVPIPRHGDPMLRLRTVEEILSDFDATSPDQETVSYLIQIKARAPGAAISEAPTAAERALPSEGLEQARASALDGIYLPNGNLNVPFLLHNADLLLNAGEPGPARNVYRTVLASGERTATALFGIGRCHEAEAKYEEACASYEESIAYHPTLDAYQRTSTLLIRQGKHQESAEMLERALNLKDLDANIRFEMLKAAGNCWTRAQKADEAERCCRRALEINPAADDIRSNLGALYLSTGDTAQAKRHFQDAVASNSANASALVGLGSCLMSDGSVREAHDAFARALELDANNPTAIFYLIKSAYELKSYATATRIVEAYVQVAPVSANLMYSLAGLQFHLGRMDDAARTARKILDIQPGHAGANEILELTRGHAGA